MGSRPHAGLTVLLAAISAAAALWSAPGSAGDRFGHYPHPKYAHPKYGYGVHRRIEHHHSYHPHKHRHRGHRHGVYLLELPAHECAW